MNLRNEWFLHFFSFFVSQSFWIPSRIGTFCEDVLHPSLLYVVRDDSKRATEQKASMRLAIKLYQQ